MRTAVVLGLLGATALAERPFLNEADTGLVLDAVQIGALPALADMVTAPDFEAAARHYMPIRNYCLSPAMAQTHGMWTDG